MPPTPTLIPVPQPRWGAGPSLTDTPPPPTIRFAVASPPPPPPVFGSGGADEPSASGFEGEATTPAPGPRMPEVGEEIQGFRLTEELGRGTFGRVFLARQAVLAGRPVALKVTLRPSREPERLARLQHTNVVPVYSVHAVGPVQLICMPFLGRQTLADALKTHRSGSGMSSGWSRKATRAQRGSTTVVTAPAHPKAPKPAAVPAVAAPVSTLVGDPTAVLRLLSQLAAGLAHAHGRGILHLDIKPGNVLIADTGEPMLLDFNLSADEAEADRELVGGTVPYMAPEQLLDMKSRGKGGVDARTDLYALGVVTYELLTGETPFHGLPRSLASYDLLLAARKSGPPPLRAKNPAVTPAVEAIVRKLLAPDPADRYQTALDLKEDVDRQLADRPLRFARDRSVAERARKWRRRNPRLLAGTVIALVVIAAGGTGAFAVQATDGRSDAEARLKADDALDRMHPLRLDLTVTDEPISATRGIARSRELLATYGLPDDPEWRRRDAFRRLPAEKRVELAGNFGELLTLLAAARVAAARELPAYEGDSARGEAVRYVRAAADCFADGSAPPTLVRLARELGLNAAAPGKAVTARDHFLDAAEHSRAGRFAEAVTALEEATLQDPGHGPAHYLLGVSLDYLGRSERASERYAFAAGLMKSERRTYIQWGCAERRGGHPGRAVRVFERAAHLADGVTPELRYHLGITRVQLGRYEEAGADLTTALTAGVRPVSTLMARAEAREKVGDRDGATADRRAAVTVPCATGCAMVERGLVREATDPVGARADYRGAVERGGPAVAEAYRGLVRLALDRTTDPTDVLRVADEATARFPHRAEFLAARAVALGRLGKAAEVRVAVAAAEKLGPNANDSFRLAGALARSADADDRRAAVRWLRQAYLAGARDLPRYEGDADLAVIRESTEYRAFRAAAGELSR